MIQVVAALIWDRDRFLACQRPVYKARGLLWEFVGGKVEQGESREEALIRECWEELGIEIAVGDIYYEVDHIYPDISIHLTLFNATIQRGTPQLIEHNAIQWIYPEEIPQLAFCPADQAILEKIQADAAKNKL
jgi:8-oxo-dGTP diphosphatase